jgi:class 3 adenylate cyclase
VPPVRRPRARCREGGDVVGAGVASAVDEEGGNARDAAEVSAVDVLDHAPDAGVLVEMVEVVGSHGLPPAHVGIHAGPVAFQEGDYFGRTVNLAARIAEYARPGEVLVSQEVVDAADGGPVTFTEIGPVELKGVSGILRLHTARHA